MTGTSVLGITYKDGVMIAADTLGASVCLGISVLMENKINQTSCSHACCDG